METLQEHLGDGVYVSYDGHHVVLRANRHDDPHPIYLDGYVLHAFQEYVKRLIESNKPKNEEGQ
jgi:hypothetical protein